MLIWNVKHCDTVAQAVSAMRHNTPDCSVSPECETRKKPWGQTIDARRKLQKALETLKALASDEYYREHGLAGYEAKCEELFEIKQRRGYAQLRMKETRS